MSMILRCIVLHAAGFQRLCAPVYLLKHSKCVLSALSATEQRIQRAYTAVQGGGKGNT